MIFCKKKATLVLLALMFLCIHTQKLEAAVFSQVDCGWGHSVGIKNDGTLWAWGANRSGQLGDGTTDYRNSPVQVGIDIDWQSVSVGGDHTVAVKTDGTLWTWGANGGGQLGDGTTIYRNSPVQVGSDDTHWQSVSAGSEHTVAIKADGTLWSWGANRSGQLGDDITDYRKIPDQVGSDTWQSVSAGSEHTVAIKTDGTLWSWGANRSGQLGDGTMEDKEIPFQVGSDTWRSVSAGSEHTVAIKTDGTLWAWGSNYRGQLGDGSTENRTSPVHTGSGSDWQSVRAGGGAYYSTYNQ